MSYSSIDHRIVSTLLAINGGWKSCVSTLCHAYFCVKFSCFFFLLGIHHPFKIDTWIPILNGKFVFGPPPAPTSQF